MSKLATTLFVFSLGFLSLANAYHGLVMVSRGEVERISKTSSEKVKVGTRIFQGDTITTGPNSYAKIVMTDRNIINVTADTKMIIELYENSEKAEIKNVELKLENGKVRCDVKENYDGKKNKFLIKTQTVIAGVRGTDFVVSYDSTAFNAEVITLKGTVAVNVIKEGKPVDPEVLVKAGQNTIVGADLIPTTPSKVPEKTLKQIKKETSGNEVAAKVDKKEEVKKPNTEATDTNSVQ